MRNLNFYISEKYTIWSLKYLGPYFYLEDLTVTFKLNYKGKAYKFEVTFCVDKIWFKLLSEKLNIVKLK